MSSEPPTIESLNAKIDELNKKINIISKIILLNNKETELKRYYESEGIGYGCRIYKLEEIDKKYNDLLAHFSDY